MKFIDKYFRKQWVASIKHSFFYDGEARYKKYITKKLVGSLTIENELKEFCDAPFDGKILFVVGEWGSGKTHHVMKFIGNQKKEYIYRSFFGIKSIEVAYRHLLAWWWKLIVLFILVFGTQLFFDGVSCLENLAARHPESTADQFFSIFLKEIENYKIPIIAIASFSLILLGEGTKIFSAMCFLLFSLFSKKIIIIDDLDRSSMAIEDQWAMLANLWLANMKYIVLLGYGNNEKKEEVIEMTNKLDGELILLPSDQDTNLKLVHDLKKDPDFPFSGDDPEHENVNSLDWMNYLTPRQLIVIVEEVRSDSKEMGDLKTIFKLFSYLTCVVDCLATNLGLNYFDRQNIVFSNAVRDKERKFFDTDPPSEKLQLRFNTRSESSPPLAVDVTKKIYKSLSSENKQKVEWIFKNMNEKDAFPSIFRFKMHKKEILKLFGDAFRKKKIS